MAYFNSSVEKTKQRLAGARTLDVMNTTIKRATDVAAIHAAIAVLPSDATMEQVYLAIPLDYLMELGW